MAAGSGGVKARVTALVGRVRGKAPWLDHLVQAGKRYLADQGNTLAASITYFSFLSLFPLLLLTVSVLGFVLHGQPDLQADIVENISQALPGTAGAQVVESAIANRGTVGVVGMLGLAYSGLGWVTNLRTAIRTVWHQNVSAGNFVVGKLNDFAILVGLGIVLLVSVAVSGIGTTATSFVVDLLGVEDVPGMTLVVAAVSLILAVVADILVFLWLFLRLPRVEWPWRRVLRGAVFAAVGFEILKRVGAFYVDQTTSNSSATYGTFGVVLGVLVWINVVSRFVMYAAVWTVTAPYDDDVRPSGTADRETARAAGIPEQFADDTSADAAPSTRQQDHAPTPLTPALQDKPGVGYRDVPARPSDDRDAATSRDKVTVAGRPDAPLPGTRAAQTAGRITAAALRAGALGVRALGAKSLRALVRR